MTVRQRHRLSQVRRWLLWSLIILPPALILTSCLSFCVGPPSYYDAKYADTAVKVPAGAKPSRWEPQKQVEPHTCGLHALSSIYLAYGLDPMATDLRFRLGTDKRATNFDPDSLGTIHPDILRVLGQDGFDATTLLMIGDDARTVIRDHLSSGHPALALIRIGELHWIVLTELQGNDVIICDSLKSELERTPFTPFVDDRVLSAILLRSKP